MESKHEDFYKKLRKKVNDWAESKHSTNSKYMKYVLAAPDLFHLLCRLTIDKEVPVEYKVKLGIAIVYFISPIDLIPDFIPVLGYLDDIAVTAYILNNLLNNVEPELIKKYWAGDGDLFEVIQNILNKADDMIGKGLWEKIKKFVDNKN
ncbi:MAG: YkvA family protein [Chitinispirillia bacterium]|jgi:uncharacterized membrane protein YkvA (DUF1232 family)